MSMIKKTSSLASIIALATFSLAANAKAGEHYIVAPQCLLKNAGAEFNTLSSKNNFAFIKTDRMGLDKLIEAKAHHKTTCGGFINVTNTWQNYQMKSGLNHNYQSFLTKYLPNDKAKSFSDIKYKVRYKEDVEALLKTINSEIAWSNLTSLTNFQDRYANSNNGVEAANWFVKQMKDLATKYNRKDISISLVETGGYKQPSVVVKLGTSNKAGIVIGSHMDTLSSSWTKKPGADDDGSGSVTTLETARVLIASGMQFKKPIYFIWYSAEEEGLIGSQEVVSDFQDKKIPVDAVIHFDMTGYAYKNEKTMWLMDDHVNKDLTAFLETLIKTYINNPVKHSACGYGCSDHASWTQGGYAAAFPFEASFGNDNPYIHSSNDTMDHLSLSHMVDYVKLGVAFAVELAEPNKS